MKYVKMLGLAAVAAAALMAFVGAGTASASVVCSTTVSPCPAGQIWPNTTVDFSTDPGTKAVLEDTFGLVKNECESTVHGTLTNGTSTATAILSGVVVSWSNCTRHTTTVTNGTLEVHNIAGTSNGTVTASGFKVTSFVPEIFGGGEVSCVFETGTGKDLGTLTEGKPATMDINTVVTPVAGSDPECPSSARWTAKYVVTTPSGTTGSLSTS